VLSEPAVPALRYFASIAPDDPRAGSWLSVFGRLRVEVESPMEAFEKMPDGRVLRLYRARISALSAQELGRAYHACARTWGVSTAEAVAAIHGTDGLAIEEAGVAIAAEEVVP
jgi:hypothetical protein